MTNSPRRWGYVYERGAAQPDVEAAEHLGRFAPSVVRSLTSGSLAGRETMLVHVGLASWIVQDGNYGDFEVGGSYRFAPEFYPSEVNLCAEVADVGSRALRHKSGGMHEVRGQVIRATDSNWVVDFGLRAYQDSPPPPWAKAGVWVSGLVYVGIDPFFYFERLKDEPGMPNLFQDWSVRRIFLETTRWIEKADATGRMVSTRDGGSPTFVEASKTDAWHDDGGNAHYVLECELQVAG